MITKEKEITTSTIAGDILCSYGFHETKTVFFDIETTGFSPLHTQLYLIGVMYYQHNVWKIKQWFAQNADDEAIVIHSFFTFLAPYETLVHFNGEGFDMPYILKKCISFNLPYNFDSFTSVDIFKRIRPLHNLLKLENYKQKTIEHFLDLNREDQYDGGQLINIYREYVKAPQNNLLELLLLHNFEDIEGMLSLFTVISYCFITEGKFTVTNSEITVSHSFDGYDEKEYIFTMTLLDGIFLPKRVSLGKESIYMTAFGNVVKIRVKIYSGELKYFYPNYKDYYYLPEEDTAIHKSVAFYVDKNFRTKAKAANCYSKKTGMFLPQYSDIINPYFKIEYHDKILYFEAEESFCNSTNLQESYIKHLIHFLLS